MNVSILGLMDYLFSIAVSKACCFDLNNGFNPWFNGLSFLNPMSAQLVEEVRGLFQSLV